MRRAHAHRVDGNQADIVKALRQIPGVTVTITSMVGKGFPDLVVGYRHRNYFLEVKQPGELLTEDELKWHQWWYGQVTVVRTFGEACLAIGIPTEQTSELILRRLRGEKPVLDLPAQQTAISKQQGSPL